MNGLLMTAAAGIGAFMGLFGGGHPVASSSMPMREPMHEQMHVASTTDSVDMSCLTAAVAARESALDSAIGTESSAITAAYSTRASALASAYAQTGNDSIRAAVKASWSSFASSTVAARKSWKSAQQAAWMQFRTAIKSCGGNAAMMSDAANAGLDAGVGGSD